jgi:hypothetical protein
MSVRTTVRMDPELLRAAKVRAAQEGITLTALIERSLRESMRSRPRQPEIKFPTAGEGGLMPGIDLDDRDTLLRFLYDE